MPREFHAMLFFQERKSSGSLYGAIGEAKNANMRKEDTPNQSQVAAKLRLRECERKWRGKESETDLVSYFFFESWPAAFGRAGMHDTNNGT